MEFLKFLPFQSVVSPSFWQRLISIKLDLDRLNVEKKPLRASYLNSVSSSFQLDYAAFDRNFESPLESKSLEILCTVPIELRSPLAVADGALINFNSLEDFKKADKNGLLVDSAADLLRLIRDGSALDDPQLLNTFLLVTFAHLKNYEFYYWFAFPTPVNLKYPIVDPPCPLGQKLNDSQMVKLLKSHETLPEKQRTVFSYRLCDDQVTCHSLKDFISPVRAQGDWYLAIIDPSTQHETPGWPLRNILALLNHYCKQHFPVRIACIRLGSKFNTSFAVQVGFEGELSEDKWCGWEKNDRGKYGPHFVNLRNNIDPLKLSESSVDLNLKLMKWRLVPDLNLEMISKQKCLLLGAGTLGCSVARSLLAWGVRHITFVDEGTVSFSNPVRQSLYEYEDCDIGQGPKMKAPTAAAALKKIFPGIVATGVELSIPLPGRATGTVSGQIALSSADKLHSLIESHDVVFLLTDSRESRWLPTVVTSSLGKLAITAALGYDSYLVLRHGLLNEDGMKLGCYFCNDVMAPRASVGDRTLDQQCTVTRPGVGLFASGLSVELFVSLLQNDHRGAANSDDECCLGSLPHSIRGFLGSFSQILPFTPAFPQCTACSLIVENEYKCNRREFLEQAFSSSTYLEDLTGLTQLHKDSELAEVLELSDEDLTDI